MQSPQKGASGSPMKMKGAGGAGGVVGTPIEII